MGLISLFKKNKPEVLQSVRGMQDILPSDQKYWDLIESTITRHAEINGYEKITTPLVENEKLFTRGTGQFTDIVEKEMFYVSKKEIKNADPEKYVLRPEGTPGIIRAYLEHGLVSLPHPVQLYYIGPMFRYSRPQKGRLRQFFQFGFEMIGTADPASDARLIDLSYSILKDLKLRDIIIQINSIGCTRCRKNIIPILKNYFEKKRMLLCQDCQRRLDSNPLRILDCKVEQDQKIAEESPALIDNLCDADQEHFRQVLEFLDDAEIPYDMQPRLVRGLDYYTRTVFEIIEKGDEHRQNALGGGGRYDDMIEQFGGKPEPAIGYAVGIERIIDLLKQQNTPIAVEKAPEVFMVQLGESAKKQSVEIINQLRKEDISVRAALSKNTIKSQLTLANRLGAKFTLILGQREAIDNTIIIRDMKEGIQEVVDQKKLIDKLKEKLKK